MYRSIEIYIHGYTDVYRLMSSASVVSSSCGSFTMERCHGVTHCGYTISYFLYSLLNNGKAFQAELLISWEIMVEKEEKEWRRERFNIKEKNEFVTKSHVLLQKDLITVIIIIGIIVIISTLITNRTSSSLLWFGHEMNGGDIRFCHRLLLRNMWMVFIPRFSITQRPMIWERVQADT